MQDINKSKKINLEELKKISLDILINVADFCEENGISYYLACGTLLGAIRHKGFIPWDDDIDIMMPRPDYEKFLSMYSDDTYLLCKPSEGRLYYAKVYDSRTIKYEEGVDYKKFKPLGVDIDIFPLDGIVNDKSTIERIYKKECFLEMLLRLSTQPIFYRKNKLKAINRIIPRIIGSKRIVKMIERNAKKYDYESSDYVVRMRRSLNGFTGALPKSVYEKCYVEFENHAFIAPKGYDAWLNRFFGNYMELPPEEKRITHICDCYWK